MARGIAQNRAASITLLLLILWGGFVRLQSLGSQPYWMDEGYTVLGIIAKEPYIPMTPDVAIHYTCPFYCIPSAGIANTFGDSPAAYRALAALAGIALIGIIFITGCAFFSTGTALLAAALVALSAIEIAWSRQARWYTLLAFFAWLGIYWAYRAVQHHERRVLFASLSALALVCAGLTHALGFLLPIALMAWLALFSPYERRETLLSAGFLILAALILQLLHPLIALDELPQLHDLAPYYLGYYGHAYWPLIVLAALSLWDYRTRTGEKALLVILILVYFVPLSFFTDIVQYRYLFAVLPALFLLAAQGAMELVAHIPQRFHIVAATIFTATLIATGIIAPLPRSFYTLESDDPLALPAGRYYAYTPQPDWNTAYAYITAHRMPDSVVVSSQPQFTNIFLKTPGYWLAHDYGGGDLVPQDAEESYVGATSLRSAAELAALMKERHGFIVFDFQATDGRLSGDVYAQILLHARPVFYGFTNYVSRVWVYEF
jgi:hypothetical protein